MSKAGKLHVELEADFFDHPKVLAAGEPAVRLYLEGLCLLKRTLTDGLISELQLPRLGLADVEARAAKLVEVGLWERAEAGWYCVGWLQRNRSAAEVAEIVATRAAAGQRGGLARALSLRVDGTKQNAKQISSKSLASGVAEAKRSAAKQSASLPPSPPCEACDGTGFEEAPDGAVLRCSACAVSA